MALITSCGQNATDGAGGGSGSTLSGIAATGAPIVNGTVEIKGKLGVVVKTTTDSSGAYSSDIASLESPFLVRVTSATGQKIISVATSADVSSGKSINVTSLTHTIVANIFGNKDADKLFDDFETEAAEYSDAKRDEQKEELLNTLITAGVIASSGIITDSSIDLMNGSLVAGSGAGMDKLLDALDIQLDTGTKILIKIKGGSITIVDDDPLVADETAADASSEIAGAEVQLEALALVKTMLTNFAVEFSKIVDCNGSAVDTGACDKNLLYEKLSVYIHPEFKNSGENATEATWSIFCRDSEGHGAKDAASCVTVKAMEVLMKDVTIHNILGDLTAGGSLAISYNVYLENKFEDDDRARVKIDNGSWKLLGNGHNYKIWPREKSIHKTWYDVSTADLTAVDSYQSQVSFYMDYDSAAKAVTNNIQGILLGTTDSALLATLGGGLAMKIVNNSLIFTAKECLNLESNAEVSDTEGGINCINSGFAKNNDAGNLVLTDTILSAMKQNTRFVITYSDDSSSSVILEDYYIKKPLKVSASNTEEIMPQLTDPNLCSSARNIFNVSTPTGIELDFMSVSLFDNNYSFYSGYLGDLKGESSVDLSSQLGAVDGLSLLNANYYLNAKTLNGNRLIRIINCH